MRADDILALFQQGLIYVEERRGTAALIAFTRIIELEPTFAPAYVERGLLLLFSDELDLAGQDFATALRIEPRSAKACHGRGWLRFYQGDFAGALRDGYQGLEFDLDNSLSYEWLIAAACSSLGEYEQALHAYNRVIARHPENVEAYYRRAQLRLEAQSGHEQALADLNRVLELEPTTLDALILRSEICIQLKKPMLALADLNAILEQNPDVATVYHWRSQIYTQMEHYGKAYSDVVHAGMLNPELRGDYRGPWVRANFVRLFIAAGAAIALCFVVLNLFKPLDLSQETMLPLDGHLEAVIEREPWGIDIRLVEYPYQFAILTGDLRYFELQSFMQNIQVGDPITVHILSRAYEDRDTAHLLVVFQLINEDQQYIDFDALAAKRFSADRRWTISGLIGTITIIVLCLFPLIRSPWPPTRTPQR